VLNSYYVYDDQLNSVSNATSEIHLLRFMVENDLVEYTVYHNSIDVGSTVQLNTEKELLYAQGLVGDFFLVEKQQDPISIIIAVISVAISVASLLLVPPTPTLRNTRQESPNNGLSERTNQSRILARIPDIVGTVRSTPDLLAQPYKFYINHQEVELAYMCVGIGNYQIPVEEVKDGSTPIQDINGASVEIFGPYTSPNYGQAQVTIGNAISEPVYSVYRNNSFNGQTILASNDPKLLGNNNVVFRTPNIIEINNGDGRHDLEQELADITSNTQIEVTNANDVTSINPISIMPNATFSETGTLSGFNTDDFNANDTITLVGSSFLVGGVEIITRTETRTISIPGEPDIEIPNEVIESVIDTTELISLDGTYVITEKTSGRLQLQITGNNNWAKLADVQDTASLAQTITINKGGVSEAVTLDGSYTVNNVEIQNNLARIYVSNPSDEWQGLGLPTSIFGGFTSPLSSRISTNTNNTIGPFDLRPLRQNLNQIVVNLVALNGLYKDDGEQQIAESVNVRISVTVRQQSNGVLLQNVNKTTTLRGTSNHRGLRAKTERIAIASQSELCYYEVSVTRTSLTDLDFEGSVVDEIKVSEVYGLAVVDKQHFGNVTTVQSLTYATEGALTVKSRKLNMLVSRRLPTYLTETNTMSDSDVTTSNALDIVSYLALSEYNGRGNTTYLDYESIYNTLQGVKDYFGTEEAINFNYTFDNQDLTFEEQITSVANACFCEAYRVGGVIHFRSELSDNEAILLFNHRNKVPRTETKTTTFGNQDRYDGVEVSYSDPTNNDVINTISAHVDGPGNVITRPNRVQTVGVRNYAKAHFILMRAVNKIKYQHTSVEFTGLMEANLLIRNDTVINTDANKAEKTYDGEITHVDDGFVAILSRKLLFSTNKQYIMFIQYASGIVGSMPITPDEYDTPTNRVTMQETPLVPLLTNADDTYVNSLFSIQEVDGSDLLTKKYLVSQINDNNDNTFSLSLTNFDARYYQNDRDLLDGTITLNGD